MTGESLLDAVVGLGANLGDPVEAFVATVKTLQRRGRVIGVSPLYRSRPIGPAQPDFHNAAVRVELEGEPLDLLGILTEIEQAHGRERSQHWGPRTLDLDVLWLADRVLDSDRLRVPHPRLVERAFALVPLLSLVPTAHDPRTARPFLDALLALGTAGLEAVSDARWDRLMAELTDPSAVARKC
jgi:2-amino-4-hydroxy-6-hydroxymethyldihydropteridine diphosphokinase